MNLDQLVAICLPCPVLLYICWSVAPVTHPTSTRGPGDAHELRITNAGAEDIQELVVLFPDTDPSTTARIEFGDVASGETTEYVTVPGGVYRYAAYEYTLGG